jgi:methyltransferase
VILYGLGLAQWLVLAVAAQRLVELAIARRNTARLLDAGGVEASRGHYPFIVILHGAWLIAVFALTPYEAPANIWLIGCFLLLQAGRIWVIASLGKFWTTRIITLPDTPLVRRGPYRWLRHPNYLIVALEIALLPLAFGEWSIAMVFSIGNAALMYFRIPAENRVLAPRRDR